MACAVVFRLEVRVGIIRSVLSYVQNVQVFKIFRKSPEEFVIFLILFLRHRHHEKSGFRLKAPHSLDDAAVIAHVGVSVIIEVFEIDIFLYASQWHLAIEIVYAQCHDVGLLQIHLGIYV